MTPQEAAGEVLATLRHLDGTPRSSVSLLTGFGYAELDDLGGFSASSPDEPNS